MFVGNEIGQQPDTELQTVDALLAEGVRGHFHGDMAHPLVGEPPQGFLQDARVGRGYSGLLSGLGKLDSERADDADRLVVGLEDVA
jgi:hypothetical protein